MPVCATIEDQIFCAHGGIPKAITKVAQLAATIPCPIYEPGEIEGAVLEMLWNDPITQMVNYTIVRYQILIIYFQ